MNEIKPIGGKRAERPRYTPTKTTTKNKKAMSENRLKGVFKIFGKKSGSFVSEYSLLMLRIKQYERERRIINKGSETNK